MTAGRFFSVLVLSLAALMQVACEGRLDDEADDETPGTPTAAEPLIVRVALAREERDRLGLRVAPVAAGTYVEHIEGQGVVLDAQPVAELMANWTAAEAAARQSRAARDRAAALFNADAAGTQQALEAAERQAAADGAALDVARAQATLAYGNGAPWLDPARRTSAVSALVNGSAVLVRASFPGRNLDEVPPALELRRLGTQTDQPAQVVTDLWFGPADPAVPGSVLLAFVAPPAMLVPGARVGAMIAVGNELNGVVVPASAIVIAGASAWCYRELEDGVFERTPLAMDRPVAGGYFESGDLAVGDELVIAGAGLLLAHELSGTEEED